MSNELFLKIPLLFSLHGTQQGNFLLITGKFIGGLQDHRLVPEGRMVHDGAEGLKETILAIDGIAIIVHTDNTVADLTVEQIAAIFKGEITNWSEVGGKDGEIVCIGREESSGTRDGFESITDTEDACKYRQELTSNGAVLTAVAENPNAIGYVSLSSVKDAVKAISVGGVAPSEATIKDGSYAVQRPFVLVTKDGVALSETAQAFFDFATSSAANEIITAAGVVPAN